MDLTPEIIESVGKASVAIIVAVGGIIATIGGMANAYFTWKTRYELDQLYAKTYRANEDGTPGPMRKHPQALVKLFHRHAYVKPIESIVTPEENATGGDNAAK